MELDRNTIIAQDARVALCYIAFEAQDNNDEETAELAMLLALPIPSEYVEDE